MNPITVRNLTLGKGRPKICVPVVGKNEAEILASAKTALSSSGDFIEWRMDWFEGGKEPEAACEMLKKLRALFDCPILATFRTKAEGGEQDISPAEYTALNLALCQGELADLIDLEFFLGTQVWKPVLDTAKSHGMKVVFSNHDFEKTPPKEILVERLTLMERAGGDISKIAVMPRNEADVLALLGATLERKQAAKNPIITMSMGKLGAISRLVGQFFGSCITFGSASAASAPGQPGAEELKEILELMGRNL